MVIVEDKDGDINLRRAHLLPKPPKEDVESLYSANILRLAIEVRILQIQNRDLGFDDILADLASELEVVIEFPEEGT